MILTDKLKRSLDERHTENDKASNNFLCALLCVPKHSMRSLLIRRGRMFVNIQ